MKGLQKFEFPLLEQPKELEIKDIPLYKEEDYYSKSPRLRRVITTKEIKNADFPTEHVQELDRSK